MTEIDFEEALAYAGTINGSERLWEIFRAVAAERDAFRIAYNHVVEARKDDRTKRAYLHQAEQRAETEAKRVATLTQALRDAVAALGGASSPGVPQSVLDALNIKRQW